MLELEKMARNRDTLSPDLEIYEKGFIIALRGLYCQNEHGEITLEQAKKEKGVLLEVYKEHKRSKIENHMKLNKRAVVEAVLLELGRYVSCGATYQEREKAYPRLHFEKRIVEVIDKAYGA